MSQQGGSIPYYCFHEKRSRKKGEARNTAEELFGTEGRGGRSEVQTLERRDGGKERHVASPLCLWEEVGEWMRGLGPQQ